MLALLILLFHCVLAQSRNLEALHVENLQLTKCDNQEYPVQVTNVLIPTIQPKLSVSGTLNTSVDLNSPITAAVVLERDVWGIWIPIPCTENVGSCTYHDLCSFGVKNSTNCPANLVKNNVPCRCPISKGTYTISPSVEIDNLDHPSVIAGYYKGQIKLTQNNQFLSCYNVSFHLVDSIYYYDRIQIV